jgi:rubredoxin
MWSNDYDDSDSSSDSSYGGYSYFYECHICDKRFNSEEARNQHENSSAHSDDEYYCQVCNKVFRTEAARDRHEASPAHYGDFFLLRDLQQTVRLGAVQGSA